MIPGGWVLVFSFLFFISLKWYWVFIFLYFFNLLEVLHNLRPLYGFAEKGFCMLGDLCPYDHGMDPVVVEDIGIPNVLSFPPPPAGNVHLVLAYSFGMHGLASWFGWN